MDRNILQGKRIAITAIDLEQKEHRGLAVMAKSLIELLKKYGADVYLITSINSFRLNRINKYLIKKKLKDEIFIADICTGLEKGFNYRKKFNQNITYKFKLIFSLILQISFVDYLKFYFVINFFLMIYVVFSSYKFQFFRLVYYTLDQLFRMTIGRLFGLRPIDYNYKPIDQRKYYGKNYSLVRQ